MEKNQHTLDELTAEAEITGDLLTITSLHATDSRGVLDGHLDYDISDREGRFDVRSSLEIPRLLQAWLGLPPLRDVLISGGQTLEAAGEFRLDEHNIPQVQMTGHARCESVRFAGCSLRLGAKCVFMAGRDTLSAGPAPDPTRR